MKTRTKFIEEVLRDVAEETFKCDPGGYTYFDQKGYLAQADLVAHKTIQDAVLKSFSGEYLLSEEGDWEDEVVTESMWIADPLCGTTNFVRGLPFYSHSLCFMENGIVKYAGIFDPNRNEMFLSDSVCATLNGERISVSRTEDLGRAIVSVNCNQSDIKSDHLMTELLHQFSPPTSRRIRVLESANLELAWVACGRMDAYINPDDKVWDVSAGSLLVSAAQGRTRSWIKQPDDILGCRGIVATNQYLEAIVDNLLMNMKPDEC